MGAVTSARLPLNYYEDRKKHVLEALKDGGVNFKEEWCRGREELMRIVREGSGL